MTAKATPPATPPLMSSISMLLGLLLTISKHDYATTSDLPDSMSNFFRNCADTTCASKQTITLPNSWQSPSAKVSQKNPIGLKICFSTSRGGVRRNYLLLGPKPNLVNWSSAYSYPCDRREWKLVRAEHFSTSICSSLVRARNRRDSDEL